MQGDRLVYPFNFQKVGSKNNYLFSISKLSSYQLPNYYQHIANNLQWKLIAIFGDLIFI